MLTSLHIQNFRAFQDLSLDGLRRVNLIAGGNNVGKTTLLEALVFAKTDFNGSLIRDLPRLFRTTASQGQNTDYWSWAIPKPQLSTCAEFDGIDDGQSPFRRLYVFGGSEPSAGKVLNFGRLGETEVWMVTDLLNQGSRIACFSTFPTDPHRDAIDFNRVILKKRRKQVESMLKEVERRLESLEALQLAGSGPALYADIGLSELIPVTQLGQGFNRLLDIYSELVAEDAKVLLIDEIENGLYWKALPIVWKGLFAAARELDVQIFATTHSLECIRAADEAARAGGNYDLALIRLDRVGDEIKPTVMGEETMRTAKEFGWEIR